MFARKGNFQLAKKKLSPIFLPSIMLSRLYFVWHSYRAFQRKRKYPVGAHDPYLLYSHYIIARNLMSTSKGRIERSKLNADKQRAGPSRNLNAKEETSKEAYVFKGRSGLYEEALRQNCFLVSEFGMMTKVNRKLASVEVHDNFSHNCEGSAVPRRCCQYCERAYVTRPDPIFMLSHWNRFGRRAGGRCHTLCGTSLWYKRQLSSLA